MVLHDIENFFLVNELKTLTCTPKITNYIILILDALSFSFLFMKMYDVDARGTYLQRPRFDTLLQIFKKNVWIS